MSSITEKLVSWLFQTNAVKVCPEDSPFWYTSGTIGPYYINTHFLYGDEGKAEALLTSIDEWLEADRVTCLDRILEECKKNYSQDPLYRELIDAVCDFLKARIDLTQVGCISGGERRDWFFSLIVADMLGKPHVSILKDLEAVLSQGGTSETTPNLSGAQVLHFADLITEASSYRDKWIPAINRAGGQIRWSAVVVDRKQGGVEFLKGQGIEPYSMIDMDKDLFQGALELGLITDEQCDMIMQYIDDPRDSMRNFLTDHPGFLSQTLKGAPKTRERALKCIMENFYNLDEKTIKGLLN